MVREDIGHNSINRLWKVAMPRPNWSSSSLQYSDQRRTNDSQKPATSPDEQEVASQ